MSSNSPSFLLIDVVPSTAGGDAHGGQEDPALQARQPRHVRLGDPRAAVGPEDLRPAVHPQRELRQPHPAQQRRLAGAPAPRYTR